MKAPDVDVTATFMSVPQKPASAGWRVELTFPANAGAEDDLLLECFDGDVAPMQGGTFLLAGKRMVFENGCAKLRYADFVAGMHDTAVWFSRPGGDPIPGYLTFA